MDNVRARLIELIASKTCFKYSKDCILREKNGGCGSCFCGFFRLGALVDHLIENGVTVEEIATAAEQPRNDMDGQRGDSCWIWTELGEADYEQF